jgi:hypothetical protein
MKGVYTAKVKKITILGRMNDINVQVEMELEYAVGVSGIDVVKEITEYWNAAGMQPPVPGKPVDKTYSAKQTGANGTHPDDLKPFIHSDGEPYLCPVCQRKLFVEKGFSKKTQKEWQRWKCPKPVGGCGAWNWGYIMEARTD